MFKRQINRFLLAACIANVQFVHRCIYKFKRKLWEFFYSVHCVFIQREKRSLMVSF